MRNPGSIYTCLLPNRYIKELAERVNRLENSGATPSEIQYAPVNQDLSGANSVYPPPLEYIRKRSHGMIGGPQMFEQELQDFSAGHHGTSSDVAEQEMQGPPVPHTSSLVHQQPRDTFNNMAPDPSLE